MVPHAVYESSTGEHQSRSLSLYSGCSRTTPDAYPVPSQDEIIAALRGATYISTVDCASFFYQWRVKREHRNRLTVCSHRGQEVFNVAVMGYRNSPAYAQRQIDKILRDQRGFARAYMDDIVIFSKNLDDHIHHLHKVFSTLRKFNIPALYPPCGYAVLYPALYPWWLLGTHRLPPVAKDPFGGSIGTNGFRYGFHIKPKQNSGPIGGITNEDKEYRAIICHYGLKGNPYKGDSSLTEQEATRMSRDTCILPGRPRIVPGLESA